MIEFLKNNLSTIIISGILLIVVAVIIKKVRDSRAGKGSCGCSAALRTASICHSKSRNDGRKRQPHAKSMRCLDFIPAPTISFILLGRVRHKAHCTVFINELYGKGLYGSAQRIYGDTSFFIFIARKRSSLFLNVQPNEWQYPSTCLCRIGR